MKTRIRILLSACLLIGAGQPISATPPDEGMWLMSLIQRLNYAQMQQMGCHLTPEQIYSVNNSSLKDAVVQLGGFCTAEVISDQGLLLTNHHCAYDAIQTFSTTQHDYLTDGFWAGNHGEELHVPGLSVSFLVRMEDVTARVMDAATDKSELDRAIAIADAISEIEDEADEDGKYSAQVQDMFNGNEYYLFVYQRFNDVRLVGAPPSSIGKFGGDTDNWMWPRHTGDFSLLRIYAGADNEPADYAEDNKPYKPRHFLPLSIKGVKENDFAMVIGYPGSTGRWLTSYAIDNTYAHDNPTAIKILEARLSIMEAAMAQSDDVRIKLASDHASLSNYYKYCIGQNLGLSRRGLADEKQDFERRFTAWVNTDKSRQAEYGDVLGGIQVNYGNGRAAINLINYINLAGFGPAIVSNASSFWRLQNRMAASEDESDWSNQIATIRGAQDEVFKNFDWTTDKKVFAAMMRLMYNDLPEDQHLSVFSSKAFTKLKPKGSADRFDLYADYVYANSMIVDRARQDAFLAKPSLKVLEGDPGVQVIVSLIERYRSNRDAYDSFEETDTDLMSRYARGVREMQPDKVFYPDANATMRLTYGTVKPYDPRDAVSYDYVTTTDGLIEKYEAGDDEFDVPEKLMKMIKAKDFGRYGDATGEMPVCFLTTLGITGGNSGSPVINGDGELIGTAFDGNWEAMVSDLVFDEDYVRTISVDIRYTLWIIDKYAGATHLIQEMTIVE